MTVRTLLPLLIVVLGFNFWPMQSRAQELQANEVEEAFDQFWQLFHEQYSLFEVKHVDWDLIDRIYRPQLRDVSTRSEMTDFFGEVINLLNDVHVSVRDNETGKFSRSGGRSIGTGAFDIGEFSLDLIGSDYLQSGLERRAAGNISFGNLSNHIGYLHIANFKYATSTEQAIDEALTRFSTKNTLIIDVRQNSGGFDSIATSIASRFTEESRVFMSATNRIAGDDRHVFSAANVWQLDPPETLSFSGQLIVLTNSRTISAAENFVLAMRAIPRSIIIGETTAGAMADTFPMTIDAGWTFSIPTTDIRDPKGRSFEGVGLTPYLWMKNSAVEINSGHDRVLDFAIKVANFQR